MVREISKMLNNKFSVFLSFLNEFFMIFIYKFFFIRFNFSIKELSDAIFRSLIIKYRAAIDAFVVIYFDGTTIIAELFCAMTSHEITAFSFLYKSAAPRTLFNTFFSHFLFQLYLINISERFVLQARLPRVRFCIAIEADQGLTLVTLVVLYVMIPFNIVILFYLFINKLALRCWTV
jgi:hypothetical protein